MDVVDTREMFTAVETAWNQLAALAVAYSFSVLGALILLVAGFMVAGAAQRWAYSGLSQIRGFDRTLVKFFSRIVRYAVLAFVIVTVLAQFGVQTASIIAALGAAGLAIGLALQGTLQNIAAGIMLLVLKPFRVGEFVEVGTVSGTVEEIGLFATEFKTFEGLYLLAPNNQLWSAPVKNYSRNPQRLNVLTVGIGYKDSIDQATKLMTEIAAKDARVLRDPPPSAFVAGLEDSWVSITLHYWTLAADSWQSKLDLTREVKEAFQRHGIELPFPQQEISYTPIDARPPDL